MSRELDARVAREVMGFEVRDDLSGPCIFSPKRGESFKIPHLVSGGYLIRVPDYSTDMNAAMEVVAHLLANGWHLKLEHIGDWQASFWQDTDDDKATACPFYESGQTEVHRADTPALAISLAALEVGK